MKRWKDHHSDRNSPLSFPAAWKAVDACNSVLERAQNVNATFDILADLSELFTSRFPQSIQPSGPITTSTTRGTSPSSHDLAHRRPRLQGEPLLVPRLPTEPRRARTAHALHGRDAIELSFNRTTGMLKLDRLVRLYLLEAPVHAPDYIMALARSSKFALLVGDAARHQGVIIRLSPLRPLQECVTSPPSPAPMTTSSELTSYIIPDPVAGGITLTVLRAFDDERTHPSGPRSWYVLAQV